MALNKQLKALCTPAYLYLVISVVLLLLVIGQNLVEGSKNRLCVGSYSCHVNNVFWPLLWKVVYIIFWTFILDALCKYGLKELAWFLVLFPIILAGILVGLLIINQGSY